MVEHLAANAEVRRAITHRLSLDELRAAAIRAVSFSLVGGA
jgi:hypothetical protein